MQRHHIRLVTFVCASLASLVLAGRAFQSRLDIPERSRRVHMNAIVVDTHADTPMRMLLEKGFDFGARHSAGLDDGNCNYQTDVLDSVSS